MKREKQNETNQNQTKETVLLIADENKPSYVVIRNVENFTEYMILTRRQDKWEYASNPTENGQRSIEMGGAREN